MDDLEDAWAELNDATQPGWFVGRPGQRYGGQWEQYAFDQTEKARRLVLFPAGAGDRPTVAHRPPSPPSPGRARSSRDDRAAGWRDIAARRDKHSCSAGRGSARTAVVEEARDRLWL